MLQRPESEVTCWRHPKLVGEGLPEPALGHVCNQAELGYRGDTVERFGVVDAICHDTAAVDSRPDSLAEGSVVVQRQRTNDRGVDVVGNGI